MSTQPPDPTPTGAYQPQAAPQYQTPAPATQAVPVSGAAQQQYQAAPVSGAAQQYQTVPVAPVAPPDVKKARGLLEPYRELAAFGLLGAVALILLAGLVRVLTGLFNSFLATATASFSNVIGFEVILLPIVAVVLVLLLDPVTPRAKIVVLMAMIEYAIAAVLGLVLLLGGLIGDFQSEGPIGWALGGFLEHLAGLALIGLGLFLAARIYLGAYTAPKPVASPYQGYQYQQQAYAQQQYAQQYAQHQAAYAAQQTGYVTGSQPAAAQPQPSAAQQPAQQAYAQPQPTTQGWQQPTTGGTPAVAAQPQGYPAQPTSGGYAAPAYATPAYATPAAPAVPAAPAAAETAAPAAQPASGPPLSSPFAAYTAPAPTPVADEPVSASPADAQSSTPPGGFASAGWPGGHSTHPAPAEEEGTAVLSPADPDATQQAPVVKPAEPAAQETAAQEAVDPDRTTVLHPSAKKDDEGEATQRTQAIPPGN
ncbi:hypothetical protein ABT369_13630 [Dactylosporangium sp. NPDC000244]|uniref:hypothetical protein n=1 Tax=Dactylosporangium sp. NPDC000244 TaxID=3154365 RepID=UPI003332ED0A